MLRAEFKLPSITSDEDAPDRKAPIRVKFEIPYFTVSGIQVYLQIFLFFLKENLLKRIKLIYTMTKNLHQMRVYPLRTENSCRLTHVLAVFLLLCKFIIFHVIFKPYSTMKAQAQHHESSSLNSKPPLVLKIFLIGFLYG